MRDFNCKLLAQSYYRFIFGATTAIITNLGLIIGLYFTSNAKENIIGSILVIALADNISDSLGIHIYQEAESFKAKEVWFSTFTNFMTRLIISLIFILFVAVFPLYTATIYLVTLGVCLIGFISYIVAIKKNINPYIAIFEHIGIAILVIVVSRILGIFIANRF